MNAPNLPLIAKGSTLNVTGDFTLAPGSTLEFDASKATLQDKLIVGGSFTASGTLKVSLDPARPAPALGDSFDFFDAGTSSNRPADLSGVSGFRPSAYSSKVGKPSNA